VRFAKRFLLVVVISFAARQSEAGAVAIFVDSTASGADNGTSWTDAYTSLQAALAAAVAGNEIWVAAGTYKPTTTADRTISFALKNGVGVYGGFAGTETLLSQRNPAANVTILSGDIGTEGVTTDNSYHVVTSDSTVTATGILDGFTVTAGRADGGADPTDRGGGVYINQGSPTFTRCIFSNNYAGNRGGGVRVAAGSPSFTDCVFQGNFAGQAGAGLGAASVGSMQIRGCIFRSNTVGNSTGGGGIEATDNTTATNCVVARTRRTASSFTAAATPSPTAPLRAMVHTASLSSRLATSRLSTRSSGGTAPGRSSSVRAPAFRFPTVTSRAAASRAPEISTPIHSSSEHRPI
jgi:hypothetical protein